MMELEAESLLFNTKENIMKRFAILFLCLVLAFPVFADNGITWLGVPEDFLVAADSAGQSSTVSVGYQFDPPFYSSTGWHISVFTNGVLRTGLEKSSDYGHSRVLSISVTYPAAGKSIDNSVTLSTYPEGSFPTSTSTKTYDYTITTLPEEENDTDGDVDADTVSTHLYTEANTVYTFDWDVVINHGTDNYDWFCVYVDDTDVETFREAGSNGDEDTHSGTWDLFLPAAGQSETHVIKLYGGKSEDSINDLLDDDAFTFSTEAAPVVITPTTVSSFIFTDAIYPYTSAGNSVTVSCTFSYTKGNDGATSLFIDANGQSYPLDASTGSITVDLSYLASDPGVVASYTVSLNVMAATSVLKTYSSSFTLTTEAAPLYKTVEEIKSYLLSIQVSGFGIFVEARPQYDDVVYLAPKAVPGSLSTVTLYNVKEDDFIEAYKQLDAEGFDCNMMLTDLGTDIYMYTDAYIQGQKEIFYKELQKTAIDLEEGLKAFSLIATLRCGNDALDAAQEDTCNAWFDSCFYVWVVTSTAAGVSMTPVVGLMVAFAELQAFELLVERPFNLVVLLIDSRRADVFIYETLSSYIKGTDVVFDADDKEEALYHLKTLSGDALMVLLTESGIKVLRSIPFVSKLENFTGRIFSNVVKSNAAKTTLTKLDDIVRWVGRKSIYAWEAGPKPYRDFLDWMLTWQTTKTKTSYMTKYQNIFLASPKINSAPNMISFANPDDFVRYMDDIVKAGNMEFTVFNDKVAKGSFLDSFFGSLAEKTKTVLRATISNNPTKGLHTTADMMAIIDTPTGKRLLIIENKLQQRLRQALNDAIVQATSYYNIVKKGALSGDVDDFAPLVFKDAVTKQVEVTAEEIAEFAARDAIDYVINVVDDYGNFVLEIIPTSNLEAFSSGLSTLADLANDLKLRAPKRVPSVEDVKALKTQYNVCIEQLSLLAEDLL